MGWGKLEQCEPENEQSLSRAAQPWMQHSSLSTNIPAFVREGGKQENVEVKKLCWV